MTTQQTSSPGGMEAKLNEALNGVENALPKGTTLTISGKSTTQAQILTALQGYLTPFTDVTTAKQAYAQAVSTRRAEEDDAREYLQQLKAALVALYGRNNPALGQYGMSAKTATKPTAETVVLAAAKRQLTRAARGTKTKAQKEQIKTIGTPGVAMGPAGTSVSQSAATMAEAAAAAGTTATAPSSVSVTVATGGSSPAVGSTPSGASTSTLTAAPVALAPAAAAPEVPGSIIKPS